MIGALLLTVLVCQAHPEKRTTFVVPFDLRGGLILLNATVNGKEAHFVLDTGAAHTHVDRKSVGASGDYTALYIDLRVQGCPTKRFPVLAHDLKALLESVPGADGILGEDFLQAFSAVRIDYKSHTVTLEE